MTNTLLIHVFLLISAPAIGSFLGLVGDRAGTGEGVVFGGSHCDHCGARLRPRDLAPILSWLLARGRSRCCGRRLRRYHLVVELMALAIAVVAVLAGDVVTTLAIAGLGWTLLGVGLLALRTVRARPKR